jgi:hypothetical protein
LRIPLRTGAPDGYDEPSSPAHDRGHAEEFLKERPLSTYYDEVALPGLKLAQNDVARGTLDRVQAENIKAAALEVVDDLAEQADGKTVVQTTHDPEAKRLLCTAEWMLYQGHNSVC